MNSRKLATATLTSVEALPVTQCWPARDRIEGDAMLLLPGNRAISSWRWEVRRREVLVRAYPWLAGEMDDIGSLEVVDRMMRNPEDGIDARQLDGLNQGIDTSERVLWVGLTEREGMPLPSAAVILSRFAVRSEASGGTSVYPVVRGFDAEEGMVPPAFIPAGLYIDERHS
jgi:hypothetical protein